MKIPALLLLALPGLASLSSAQVHSAGPLLGASVAIAVDGGVGADADARTLIHPNGLHTAVQLFPAGSGQPDLQTILAQHAAPNLDIDDISSGRDDIMVDPNGFTDPPQFGWGMFTFSFHPGAQGAAGSRLAAEPAADRAAAIFSWILPESEVPPPLIGVVERSHSRDELGLQHNENVDSLDVPLLLGMDQGSWLTIEPGFQSLLPPIREIYFTVANNSLANVPASWFIDPATGGPIPASGATVLVTREVAGTPLWTVPQIYRTYSDLGLQQADDIDALAVDATRNELIVSCVGHAYDQLLFIDATTDGTPRPIKQPGGIPVSTAIGSAGNDDIDAVCTLDPQVRITGSGSGWVPDDFGAACGTPRTGHQTHLYPVGMQAAAFRRYENSQSHYDSWMIGWPPNTGQGPGWAILGLTFDETTQPRSTVAILPRDPLRTNGDPQFFSQAIPPSFVLIGVPIMFRWFATDAGGSEISQAWPVKVFL